MRLSVVSAISSEVRSRSKFIQIAAWNSADGGGADHDSFLMPLDHANKFSGRVKYNGAGQTTEKKRRRYVFCVKAFAWCVPWNPRRRAESTFDTIVTCPLMNFIHFVAKKRIHLQSAAASFLRRAALMPRSFGHKRERGERKSQHCAAVQQLWMCVCRAIKPINAVKK